MEDVSKEQEKLTTNL